MIRLLVALLALSTSTSALAAGCPWNPNRGVEVWATMTTVSVDGVVYPVTGSLNKQRFMGILATCGEHRALEYFEQWRWSRVAVNATAAAACLGFPLVFTPIAAVSAGVYRDDMVQELSRPKS